METRIENWCGHNIRFVEFNGEWLAILKDVCDALELRTAKVAERLDPEMMIRVPIEVLSKDVNSRGAGTVYMLAVNEIGIYEALFASRRLEARKLRRWTASVLQRLRRHVGLEGYEVLQMTDEAVQQDIDHFLDTIFYDEENNRLMMSVTVQGGDVDQVPVDFNPGEL